MQRYITVRLLQSVLTILVVSIIVFSLARVTGNPLDVLLPLEATPEDYERGETLGAGQAIVRAILRVPVDHCVAILACPGSGRAIRPWVWWWNVFQPPSSSPGWRCSLAS